MWPLGRVMLSGLVGVVALHALIVVVGCLHEGERGVRCWGGNGECAGRDQ